MGARRQFSREYKKEAVDLVTQRGLPAARAARELGIDPNLLCRWVRERDAGQSSVTRLLREVTRLERRREAMSHEILKQIAEHFESKYSKKPDHGDELNRPGIAGDSQS